MGPRARDMRKINENGTLAQNRASPEMDPKSGKRAKSACFWNTSSKSSLKNGAGEHLLWYMTF